MATVRSLMAFILNLIRKLKSGQWLGTGLMVTIVAELARARILSSLLLGSRSECQRVVRLNTTACVRVFGDCRTRGVIWLSGQLNRVVSRLRLAEDRYALPRAHYLDLWRSTSRCSLANCAWKSSSRSRSRAAFALAPCANFCANSSQVRLTSGVYSHRNGDSIRLRER
jgi:hypothetical protein